MQSALAWSFLWGGPANDEDWARFNVMTMEGKPIWEAAKHEEPRWMARGLRALRGENAFPDVVGLGQIDDAVSIWCISSRHQVQKRLSGDRTQGKENSPTLAGEEAQVFHRAIMAKPDAPAQDQDDFSEVLRLADPDAVKDFLREDPRAGRMIRVHHSTLSLQKKLLPGDGPATWGYVIRDMSNPAMVGLAGEDLHPIPDTGALLKVVPGCPINELRTWNGLDWEHWIRPH
jgi:hypothetical protein